MVKDLGILMKGFKESSLKPFCQKEIGDFIQIEVGEGKAWKGWEGTQGRDRCEQNVRG